MKEGIETILYDDIRWLRCDIKSINLLGNVLANQKATEMRCDEAILHRGGRVTEASSANVFIVKDDIIITHPANNYILNGIMRKEVIKLARLNGIELIENDFFINDLLYADEVFVTSTSIEITPVVKVDNQEIANGQPGKITQLLQEKFERELDEFYLLKLQY